MAYDSFAFACVAEENRAQLRVHGALPHVVRALAGPEPALRLTAIKAVYALSIDVRSIAVLWSQ